MNLNDKMDFGHIITVDEDGNVTDSIEDAYFELNCIKGDDGEWHDEFSIPEGWALLTGTSGQDSYSGPVNHASEFIGGGLERYILETPGHYVALVVESDCGYTEEHCTEESGCDCEPAGWAIAYKPLD